MGIKENQSPEDWQSYFSSDREESQVMEVPAVQPKPKEQEPLSDEADLWRKRFSQYDTISGQPKLVSQEDKAKELANYYKDHATVGIEGFGRGIQRQLYGAKQLVDNTKEYLGFTERGTAALETEKSAMDLESFFGSERGKDPMARLGAFEGEVLPTAMLFGAAPAAVARFTPEIAEKVFRTKSFLGGVGRNAAAGGVSGFMQFVENDSLENQEGMGRRAWNTIIGASFGAGIGSIAELSHIGQNFAWKTWNAMRRRNPSVMEQGKRLEEQYGLKLDPFQLNPTPEGLSVRTAMQAKPEVGYRLGKLQENNLANFEKRFRKQVDDAFQFRFRSPEQAARTMHESWDKARNGLVMHRMNVWDSEMQAAAGLAGKSKFIPINNLRNTLSELNKELNGTFVPEDLQKLGPGIRKLMLDTQGRDAKGRITGKALMSVEDMQKALKRFGNLAFAKRGVADSVTEVRDQNYRKIYEALQKDFNNIVDNPDYSNKLGQEALNHLKNARVNWSVMSDRIAEMDSTVAAKLLGKDSFSQLEPKDIVEGIKKMSPGQIGYLSQVMDQVDPHIMEGARGLILKESLERSFHANPESVIKTTFDPDVMWENLPKGRAFEALFPNKTQQKQFEGALNAVSRLVMGPNKSAGQVLEFYQNTFGNVSTMSPTFLSIQMAKRFVPERLWKDLMTEEGRRGLMQLVSSKTPSQFANAMAVLFTDDELFGMLNEGLPESEVQKHLKEMSAVERFKQAQGGQ